MTVDGTRLTRTLCIHSLVAGFQGAERTSVFVDNCGGSARRRDVTVGVGRGVPGNWVPFISISRPQQL